MNDPSTQPDRLLTGRYALDELLGSGGAGTVWRAHDRLLDRTVAVKLLHRELDARPPTDGRFRTEASIAAKLTHPNAVIVYDIGQDDGHDYLVMEYVEGGTLADVLVGGPLPPGVVAGLGSQVAQALGVAHARRLVHRDIKPANVLITVAGIAKVADFGIAQALGTTSSQRTLPGQVMGTARYLAPEQLRGEVVDARADVYALGVVLHEALTGEVPFGEGTIAEVASRRLVASLPRTSEWRTDVPAALDEAIARATELEPGDRFVNGEEFATELARSATRGAASELAARLAAGRSRPSPRRDPMTVTADLLADEAKPAIARAKSRLYDEPTAAMAIRPAPLEAPPSSAPGLPVAVESTAASAPPAAAAVDRPDPPEPPEVDVGRDGDGEARRARRSVLAAWLALAALVGGSAIFAMVDRSQDRMPSLDEASGDDDEAANNEVVDEPVDDDGEGDAPGAIADVVDSRDHDPFGSGEENRADVVNAFDGNATTVWQTQGYRGNPQLGGLKPGVGFWLDLGDPQEVAEVDVAMGAPGASFTLYVGSSPPGSDAAPESWGRAVAEVGDADARTQLTLDEPAEGRVWLLWFTSLPADGDVFRVTVSDVRLVRP